MKLSWYYPNDVDTSRAPRVAKMILTRSQEMMRSVPSKVTDIARRNARLKWRGRSLAEMMAAEAKKLSSDIHGPDAVVSVALQQDRNIHKPNTQHQQPQHNKQNSENASGA